MRTAVVRYRVLPEAAAINEALIRKIFEQLEREKLAGLRYQVFKLDDGVSFVHVVSSNTQRPEDSPLPKLEAFRNFVAELRSRCEERPVNMQAQPVGAYDSLG
jgi:hypothetical protein